ncbi:MAG: hypothetical protein NDI69_12670 [Bacteriovoracaceae bacterium]|nr:hypothetical protein [Bacteriovoracaceae bacterium]
MRTLTSVLFLVFCFSCGKAPGEPQYTSIVNPAGEAQREALTSKEIKSSLQCQVSIQNQIKDQFVWGNPTELSLIKILNYRVASKNISFIIRLEGALEDKNHLNILYFRTSKNVLNDGTIHDRGLYQEATLYENVETQIYAADSEIISCTLNRITP